MASNPGSILGYEGYDRLVNPPLPIFAIPTTVGTGSECTASTVFTNKQTLFKTVIVSPKLFPRLAILDPALSLGLPDALENANPLGINRLVDGVFSREAL
ncbi:iron-containing alcohol dehydrogenase [Pseudomonas aeruginosa]|nr:iron-containing alcohol dehydrogenase [Pseudomonas aeruginosa]MCV4114586.1 iron-containing alcohol dehydrogenase [Pseudomonas aeruginosa]MCV4247629.1 iron-containing alcohol dehydrogenase [Pseudomonas aeruginosa]MCV4253481.1 iron-containing alcohol dehydrogenase [Pseudomonas aeruginosa]